MLSRLKRSSGLLFLFFVVFSTSIVFLSVRQLHGEDSGVSGGAEGSTTIVTGTDDKCKEPSTSTEECITHTCTFDPIDPPDRINCKPGKRTAPSGGEIYCVGSKIIYSLALSEKDAVGKEITRYKPCPICGATREPPTTEVSHSGVVWPKLGWIANDCGANSSHGPGETAEFTASEPSFNLKSSSVVFSTKPPDGSTGNCEKCGTLDFDTYTVNFTVVEVGLTASSTTNISPKICLNAQEEYTKAEWIAKVLPSGTTAHIEVITEEGAVVLLDKASGITDGETITATGYYPGFYKLKIIHDDLLSCEEETDSYPVFEFITDDDDSGNLVISEDWAWKSSNGEANKKGPPDYYKPDAYNEYSYALQTYDYKSFAFSVLGIPYGTDLTFTHTYKFGITTNPEISLANGVGAEIEVWYSGSLYQTVNATVGHHMCTTANGFNYADDYTQNGPIVGHGLGNAEFKCDSFDGTVKTTGMHLCTQASLAD